MSVEIRLDPETFSWGHFIADAEGCLRAYRIVGLRAAPVFGVDLERADDGSLYRVRECGPGRWSCTCPDFTYRGRRRRGCKHVAAARALREYLRWLRRLAQQGVRDAPDTTSKAALLPPFQESTP
jgi:hypothetical protein